MSLPTGFSRVFWGSFHFFWSCGSIRSRRVLVAFLRFGLLSFGVAPACFVSFWVCGPVTDSAVMMGGGDGGEADVELTSGEADYDTIGGGADDAEGGEDGEDGGAVADAHPPATDGIFQSGAVVPAPPATPAQRAEAERALDAAVLDVFEVRAVPRRRKRARDGAPPSVGLGKRAAWCRDRSINPGRRSARIATTRATTRDKQSTPARGDEETNDDALPRRFHAQHYELVAMRSLFEKYDTNKDGMLEPIEIKVRLRLGAPIRSDETGFCFPSFIFALSGQSPPRTFDGSSNHHI